MNRIVRFLTTCAIVAGPLSVSPAAAERISLTQDWRFHAGDAAGGEASDFDAESWRKVSVPHDFSIMDRPDGAPPFDPKAVSGQDSGYLPGGVGWYRRDIDVDARMAASVVELKFEAIYMDADVWVNGVHLVKHHYGYSAFTVDLTGKLKPGRNVVAVRVNHVDPSSRWYAGSGIIRPVYLDVLDKVHIASKGPTIVTPVATEQRGEVAIATPVVNRSDRAVSVELTTTILDGQKRRVAQLSESRKVAAGASVSFSQQIPIDRPALWSPDSPNLYRLAQSVKAKGVTVDERETRFGIRVVTLDAQNGLRVNGVPIKLRGGAVHHDNYMLGAAAWPDADARKVALMKYAGYNAIRSAHNPASQATLDAADELGMLVIDEAFDMWNISKKAQDYSRYFKTDWRQDLDSLIENSRNHPSIIFWSIGNEVPEQGMPKGVETARMLAARVKALDPTRPVTQALHMYDPLKADQLAAIDVVGLNYRADLFAKAHADYPDRVTYSSESVSKALFKNWRIVEAMPSVLGDFVWTAVDYLGESGIGWMGYSKDLSKLGPYPWHLAYSGEIDATGRKRPAAYYREVIWNTGDPISAFVRQPAGTEDLPDRNLFTSGPAPTGGAAAAAARMLPDGFPDWSLEDVHPSWTWPGQEGKPLDVVVYSAFPEVELKLNGKSLGRKPVNVGTEYKASFSVPYRPGALTAVGYRDGRPAGEWRLRTAGKAATVRVTLDRTRVRANGSDLVYATAELVDANGVPVYAQADDLKIDFQVVGAGRLAGAGSGHPMRPESLQSGKVTSFHGRAIATVQSTVQAGAIQLIVSAQGLEPQRVTIESTSE